MADTKSWKHRRIEVGRDLWGSYGSAHQFKQDQLDQVVQNHVQMAFEYQSYLFINITGLQRTEEKHYL